ncbi:zinc finger domain-containing protein [Mycobacterium seoulense]
MTDQTVIAGLGNHGAMTQVLRTAVRHGRVGGRTTFWCPRCQA